MARLEHAATAVVLLVTFVADLRFVVPVLAVALAAHAWLTRSRFRAVEAGLLTLASVAFLLDGEVAAWALALAAAVLCGVAVGASAGPQPTRRVGSSGRAG